ncbi:MAG: dihydrolipoyllysine-residue acetyltransferase [Pseudomonadota bacterium]
MSNDIELTVPDLGDFTDVEVIEILVSPGDAIEKEDGILTLETDKAAMDVPASDAGTLKELKVATGDTVNAGDVYAVLTPADEAGGSDAADQTDEADDDAQDDSAEFAETEVLPDDALEAAVARSGGDGDGDGDGNGAGRGGGGSVEIRVPDLGDYSDVEIVDVLVAEGDRIAVEDGLITLETDKATMDVPSSHAGTVKSLRVSAGDTVSEGDVIAVVETERSAAAADGDSGGGDDARDDGGTERPADAGAAAAADEAPRRQRPERAPATPKQRESAADAKPLPTIDEAGFARAHASPSVRKLARELGVNLVDVKGSGRKGRVLHDDVKAWVKRFLESGAVRPAAAGAAALPAVPEVDFARFGPVRDEALSRIQKIAGPRLQASWINLPHVTQHDLADITELEQRRQELKGPAKEKGISLTPLAFVIRAVIMALEEFPRFAASLTPAADALIMKDYRHIGFAADTPNGLVVPVIQDADRLDIYELAQALGELSALARDGKLKANQMQGAVFTLSSLGGIGGTAFTPIVNAPEVAILGVSRHSMQPVWNGNEFEPRLLLPLSLSYDHRVIDGAAAVRFTTRLGEILSDVGRLLEATP